MGPLFNIDIWHVQRDMSGRAVGFIPVTRLPEGKAYAFLFPGREVFENRKNSDLERDLGRTAGTLYNLLESRIGDGPAPTDYETLIVTADYTFPNDFGTWNMTQRFNEDPHRHFDSPAMEFVHAMWGRFIPDVKGEHPSKANDAVLSFKKILSATGMIGISFGSVFMQQVANALKHLMLERGYTEAHVAACTGSLLGLSVCSTSDLIAKSNNIPTAHFISIYDSFARFRSTKNEALMDEMGAKEPDAMIMDRFIDPRTLLVLSRPPKKEVLSARMYWIGEGIPPYPQVSHVPAVGEEPRIDWEITGNRFPDPQSHDPRGMMNLNRMSIRKSTNYFQTSPTAHIIHNFGITLLNSCIECGRERSIRNGTEWLRTMHALMVTPEEKLDAAHRIQRSEQSFIEMVTDHTGKPQIWQGRK